MYTNSHNSSTNQPLPTARGSITQMNRQSLMSMMKQIMQKSMLYGDELHCVVEESNECSESMIVNQANQDVACEQAMREVYRRMAVDQAQEVNKSESQFQKQTKGSDHCRVNSLPTKSNISNSLSSNTKSPSSISKVAEDPSLSSTSTHQFSKLIEITSRCVEYYNNFVKQKSLQFQIIEKTVTDMNSNLDMAFGQIISEAQKKHKELKQFLMKKYTEIIQYRNQQDNGLKITLEDIRSVHLTNLMKNGKTNEKSVQYKESSRNQFLQQISKTQIQLSKDFINTSKIHLLDSSLSEDASQLSFQLHNYASTLNQFYVQMEQIERSNYKQMVEQSVSFINNLICEEIKVLMNEKIPSKLCQKRMMRQNSKDFLLESSLNQGQSRGQNFGLLDLESFTKLFLESSKLVGDDEKIANNNKPIEEIFNLIESRKHVRKNNLQENVDIHSSHGQLKEWNKQKKESLEKTYLSKKSSNLNNSNLSPQGQQNKSLSNEPKKTIQKSNFIKKQIHYQQNPPSIKKCLNEDLHKQNSLQLIKKISSQQNNRSVKIKGYMVSFQDSSKKQALNDNISNKMTQRNRSLNNSKSPNNKSKTPTKLNKSGQKRVMTVSNVVQSSNQTKAKSSLQSSLKSSRNSGYVSEFKILSSRRPSVALK